MCIRDSNITATLIINELLLMIIGIGVAGIANTFMPSLEDKFKDDKEWIEEHYRIIIHKIAKSLITYSVDIDEQKLMDEIEKRLYESKETAYKIVNNNFFKSSSYYTDCLLYTSQMIVVNQQGIIAIEVIRRNNKELIRGVDRAKNVTISALRTATIVASALYNQKIVLKKIDILNKTTNDLISGTSKMLKEQGAEIQKQAIENSISVDTLKNAFSDTLEALNSISSYKQEALPKLKETINQFRELADLGEKQISKIEKQRELN